MLDCTRDSAAGVGLDISNEQLEEMTQNMEHLISIKQLNMNASFDMT